MVKRNVVWTATASKQRREILKYWTLRNGSILYAEKLINLTKDQIKIISDNPKAFKQTTFPDVRVSSLGHFSIFYKTTDENLIVVAFWDNRQDPKKLLDLIKN